MKAIRFGLACCFVFVVSPASGQSPSPAATPVVVPAEVKPTITSGRQVAAHADLSGSKFSDVSLAGSEFSNVTLEAAVFENVNLTAVKMHNANLSDLTLSGAQLGGARFEHIGPPPDASGGQPRQRPVTFVNAILCDSTFTKVDLSGVKIVDCNLEGATIDGVPVSELIKAYKKLKE